MCFSGGTLNRNLKAIGFVRTQTVEELCEQI